MYVRWKKRRHTQPGVVKDANGKRHWETGLPKSTYALTAALVESKRVNGSPRQRFVAHLGTLQVYDSVERPTVVIGTGGKAYQARVVAFWRKVEKRLDALGDVVPDREQIELKITKTVPRPDEQTRQRIDQMREEWEARLAEAFSSFGRIPARETTEGTTPGGADQYHGTAPGAITTMVVVGGGR